MNEPLRRGRHAHPLDGAGPVFADENLVGLALARMQGSGGFILPGQFGAQRLVDDSPEHRLLQSVLLTAIEDILSARTPGGTAATTRRRSMAAALAKAWIGGAGATVPFDLACAAFGVPVEAMRSKIAGLDRQARGHGSGKRILGGYGRALNGRRRGP